MQTRSSRQHRTNSETSDRLTPRIQTRPWSDPLYEQPEQSQKPHQGYDLSNIDLFSHDPGPREYPQVNLGSRSPAVQAKLTVGAPNDGYEQEADRVAEQVMSTPEAATQPPIQREMAAEEEEPVQAKPLAAPITPWVQRDMAPEKEEPLQAKGAPDATVSAESNLESRLSSSQGRGSPLPDDVKSFMEPRFGADFSGVRVHTGEESVQMSRSIGAQAFTHRNDVYFGAGHVPGNDALTAHELTHVVQQTSNIQRFCQDSIQRQISTPLPSGVAPGKKTGNASFQHGSFKVKILPDGKQKFPGAETTIKYNWGKISYKTKAGVVTSFKGPGQPSVTIQTLYGPGLSASSTSAYGRGTASGDSDNSLGFHEGNHGKDFLTFMSKVPIRNFFGTDGMTVSAFKTEIDQWKLGCQQYSLMLQMFTTYNTDCVGTTIDQYNASRGIITTKCPLPNAKKP